MAIFESIKNHKIQELKELEQQLKNLEGQKNEIILSRSKIRPVNKINELLKTQNNLIEIIKTHSIE